MASQLARAARFAAGGLALVLSACSSEEPVHAAAPAARPNVVLIVVDTLRADRLGCYGYERPTSPVIDKLARDGALFLEARAQASWTAQSMVSLMSGRYLTDVCDVLEDDATSLAERFHAAGYRTLGVVGNVMLQPERGFGQGFDRYDARRITEQRGRHVDRCRTFAQLVDDFLPVVDRAREPLPDGSRAPLFLYVHPVDPHAAYVAHAQYDEQLPVEGATPRGYFAWQREQFEERGAAAGDEDPGWEDSWATMRGKIGRYDQEVRYTDAQLGRLLSELKQRGVLDNAIVALVADHGETLYDNIALQPDEDLAQRSPTEFFQMGHTVFLYGALIRTPMILWGSGVPDGLVVEQPVENVDLYPTLLELARLPEGGDEVHGRSLVPFLEGRTDAAKPYVFALVEQHASVIEAASSLKLVLPTGDGLVVDDWRIAPVPQLYDVANDPLERVNLYDARPRDVARLTAVLEAWQRAYPTDYVAELEHHPGARADLEALGYLGGEGE
ncbi:MAG: sulfatase-like hydrolase/transferase [Planctomycetes bacterium]|nr:sulfatase-like hydrolase/transferase [Planctomycetota bacterium]